MSEEGLLAEIADGIVKALAFNLRVTPQRVHQILANDPFAAYMRVHRAMAEVAPDRAQQMADEFNAIHDGLMMKRQIPSREAIISNLAEWNGRSLASAISNSDLHQRLHAALMAQRANADHIASLFEEVKAEMQVDATPRPKVAGGQQ